MAKKWSGSKALACLGTMIVGAAIQSEFPHSFWPYFLIAGFAGFITNRSKND